MPLRCGRACRCAARSRRPLPHALAPRALAAHVVAHDTGRRLLRVANPSSPARLGITAACCVLTRHSRAASLPAPRRRPARDAMAESGGCAGSAAASHVFGVCDLCGEETDQSLAPLVLVQCNQKACPDRRAPSTRRVGRAPRALLALALLRVFGAKRLSAPRLTRRARRVYHQDCLLDHLESASASRRRAHSAPGEPLARPCSSRAFAPRSLALSDAAPGPCRRTFYLKKQTYFDLAGACCSRARRGALRIAAAEKPSRVLSCFTQSQRGPDARRRVSRVARRRLHVRGEPARGDRPAALPGQDKGLGADAAAQEGQAGGRQARGAGQRRVVRPPQGDGASRYAAVC